MRKSANMCTKLAATPLEERLRWVLPIVNKEIKLIDAAKVFPGGQRTLERWVATFKQSGEAGLLPKSTKPHHSPNKTNQKVEKRIIQLRNKTRLCAKKLNYKLIKEDIQINTRTIGCILKRNKLTRKYKTRKLQWKYVKPAAAPGDMIEVDVKYVPENIGGKQYYQFTAIDWATRWRLLKIYDDIGNGSAIAFLNELNNQAPFKIRAIKTDNGTLFTNRYVGYAKSNDPLNPRLHPFDLWCLEQNITHYLIDPGKPAQNGKVERSHRTDQELFYDRTSFASSIDLERKIKKWNKEYNNLEHCSLAGKTPNEMLLSFIKPPNVLA